MIEIINKKKYYHECNQCKTEFTYENEDIKMSKVAMNESLEFVPCPCCKHEQVAQRIPYDNNK